MIEKKLLKAPNNNSIVNDTPRTVPSAPPYEENTGYSTGLPRTVPSAPPHEESKGYSTSNLKSNILSSPAKVKNSKKENLNNCKFTDKIKKARSSSKPVGEYRRSS